jgi:hypothetical protein
MKLTGLLALLLAAAPAAAEFRPFNSQAEELPPLNFCGNVKFVIAAGSCSPGGKYKDVINPKSCEETSRTLYDSLSYLYPNASVEFFQDLTPDELTEKLARPLTAGFFLVGEGDTKGGFLTGPEREPFYPSELICGTNSFDLYGGFTSHSKYSPQQPAPKADRALVISRTQTIYDGAAAPAGSWAKLCKPRISLVYPTRTFAGRMKDDVKKLVGALQDEKKKHVLKTLGSICDNCQGHLQAGDNLAQLCPPNSNVCKARKILPGTEEFILKNYCSALAPTPSRQ